jgi:5-methylcytosine-specific restriction endonuclease McrA
MWVNNATFANFKAFEYSDNRIKLAILAYQLRNASATFCNKPVSTLDNAIKDWMEINDTMPFKEFFDSNRIIGSDDFYTFYGDDERDRKCFYCKIKETEIKQLIGRNLIYSKRLSTRGITMEVDRQDANKGYVKGNIVTCCYWCNNAKTDEFDDIEFDPIGKLIGETLRKRLEK